MKPTVERLRELFDYNPETGYLTCKPGVARKRHRSILGGENNRGYLVTSIADHPYLVHRIVYAIHYGYWPELGIDHVNGEKTDNRICNLRQATVQQNSCNKKISKLNKSGVRGVYWNKDAKRWHAQIKANGRQYHLGHFTDKEDAAIAYAKAAAIYHGEFANPAHATKI